MDNLIKRLKKEPEKTIKAINQTTLTQVINHLSDHYYNRGQSLVSDDLFDYVQSFQTRKKIGHPVKKKATLPYFMSSLDKIKPSSKLFEKWSEEFQGPYVLSYKLDGVSGLLYKKDNRLYLYTRGDGKQGQDVSHLIPFLRFNNDSIDEGECVRGEFIISKENFKKISEKMSNARNGVAGIINTLIPDPGMLSFVDFMCYSVLSPNLPVLEQYTWLQQKGFRTPYYCLEKRLTLENLSKELLKARSHYPYEIDGIVVCDSSRVYPLSSDSNPKHAFAFKQVLLDQIAETTVLDVLWDVSKDKYLKPRVKIQTVELLGSEISFATAHNAKYIFDHQIGPGSRILIVKSGDVIPYIQKIMKPSDSGFPKMPDRLYKWTTSKTDIVSLEDDARVTVKKLLYFFKTLDIKYWAECTIEKYVASGYDDIFKILGADDPKLEGIGEKMLAKLKGSLEDGLQHRRLYEIMAASQVFGRGIALKKFRSLTESLPDLLERSFPFPKVQGFDEKTMIQVMENLSEFKMFLSRLLEMRPNLLSLKKEKKKDDTKPTIVLTGFRDQDLEQHFNISDSVTRQVNCVVAKDPEAASSKLKKARELGIPVLSVDELKKKIDQR